MRVFITGAGRGVGRALAQEYARRGDWVFAGVRDGDAGQGVTSLPLDVTDLESVRRCVRAVDETTGGLDLLINNAAILGPLDRGTEGELDYAAMLDVFNVNALGALRTSQEFWPLLARGGKLIANISSEAGSIADCGRDGWFGYGMSKAALNMASAQFHNAVRPTGGRVLVLHPGWVRTHMQGSLDDRAPLSPEQSAAGLAAVIDARGAEVHDRPLFLQWNGEALPW